MSSKFARSSWRASKVGLSSGLNLQQVLQKRIQVRYVIYIIALMSKVKPTSWLCQRALQLSPFHSPLGNFEVVNQFRTLARIFSQATFSSQYVAFTDCSLIKSFLIPNCSFVVPFAESMSVLAVIKMDEGPFLLFEIGVVDLFWDYCRSLLKISAQEVANDRL